MKQEGITISGVFIKLEHQIINHVPNGYEAIATVSDDSIKNVKKELLEYIGKGYEFYYFKIGMHHKPIHVIRVYCKL